MANPFAAPGVLLTEVWWSAGPVFLVLACLLPIFVIDTVRLSSRFAGPLHRFGQVLRDLAAGENAEKVEFRQNDFWKQLASDLNRVSDRLKTAHDSTTSAPGELATAHCE
jgi:hypothetical protein